MSGHHHHHHHHGEAKGGLSLALAAGISGALALTKLALGLWSGSMTLLASAADSFADTAMSTLNAWGYRWARTPADASHPFGHGKLEGVLAVGQGMLLIGLLVALAIGSLLGLSEGREMPKLGIAMAGLAGGGVVSLSLTGYLHYASKRDDSLLLLADAAHYRLDFLNALVALGGLAAAKYFELAWLDPLLCLGIAAFMLPDCVALLRQGGAVLLDEALPAEDQARVKEVLDALDLPYHGLRTRRSGPISFVEVHVALDPRTPLGDAHQLVQAIAGDLRALFPGNARVLVHPDAEGLHDAIDDALEQEAKAHDHEHVGEG